MVEVTELKFLGFSFFNSAKGARLVGWPRLGQGAVKSAPPTKIDDEPNNKK